MDHTCMRCMIAIVGSVMVFGLLTGCAGRRISTSVSDQAFVPGPSPRAETSVVEEAKVVPVVPVPPTPVEPPQVVQPPAPARVEEAMEVNRAVSIYGG